MITISIQAGDLQKCLNQLDKYDKETRLKIVKQVKVSAVNIQAYAKQNVPKRSAGAGLSGSIYTALTANGHTATVSTNKPYAAAIEFGLKNRKPIFPKNKKALAFGARMFNGRRLSMTPGGAQKREVVVKAVYRPGDIQPHPYMRPAAEKETPRFINSVRDILNMKK